MRGITIRQPHAWAVVYADKIENRSRNIAGSYRGWVAIHAGRERDDRWMYGYAWPAGAPTPRMDDAPTGVVIGVARLVDVHHWRDEDDCNGAIGDDGEPTCSPWGMADHWHLVWADRTPLPHPIPWRGALGLWTVPDELEAAIREQVTL